MSYRKFILFSLLAIARFPCSIRADDVVAYRGATIETVAKAGAIANGTILLRNGRIESVGADVAIPPNARIVDVSGQTVMPALIDVYHPVTIDSGSTSSESRTVTIGGRTFTIPGSSSTSAVPFIKISDNLDPLSLKSSLSAHARYGVGLVNVVKRGYGQSVTANVTPDDVENSITNKDGALFLAVTNTTASLDVLRNGLRGRPSSSGGGSGPGGARGSRGGRREGGTPPAATTTTSSTPTPAGNSLTSLWESVKEGKTPIIVNVNNPATILYVLDIQKEYGKVQMILVAGGDDIYQTLEQLKDRKVSVILRAGLDIAPRSNDRINVAKRLSDANVNFGFSTSLDSSLGTMPDTPMFPVAMLVKTGLSRKAAIEALTLTPAKMLGLDKTLGTIETGKQANLIFLDGDPLTEASRIQLVLVEGKSVYEN